MAEPVLSVRDLSVVYAIGDRRRLAIDAVSLQVGAGEILGVVGESGSGKSTLSTAIMRLLPSNGSIVGGQVSLAGRGDLARLSDADLRTVRGGEIAVVFQDPSTSLNPRLPIGRQMVQILRAHRAGGKSEREEVVDRLEEVGIPSPRRAIARYPHEFSGGMRQRVMIAMALLLEPKLIIADEATSALDVTLEAQILELLLRLRDDHGTSLLYISHDLGVVSQFCDRVAVMYAGRIVEEIAGDQVLAGPRHPYTQALKAAVPTRDSRGRRLASIGGHMPDVAEPLPACGFAARCLYTTDACTARAPGLVPTPTGHARCFAYDGGLEPDRPAQPCAEDWRSRDAASAAGARSAPGADEQPPLVSVDDLAVYFGGGRSMFQRRREPVRAVDGVSLTLRRGRVLGIVGESGSGKSTLGEALVKLNAPTSGTITFDGQDVTRFSKGETFGFRRQAQMIFQNPYQSLSPRMRVSEQLTEPYRIHRIAADRRRSVGELLASVDLPASLGPVYPSQLSGGQARRVGIARALALEPTLVVADEPTSGLDASAAASAVNLLSDLRDRTGLTLILITHSLPLVVAVADELCVMYFGQIVERGSMQTILQRPAHPYTKALLALAPDQEPGQRLVRRQLLVPGEIPSPDEPPEGCRFHPRCPYAQDICRTAPPSTGVSGESDAVEHLALCHFADEIATDALSPVREVAGVAQIASPEPARTGEPDAA
jgi:peptide/nickel transport system ATP-binding protein